jgi:hypothetical protein
MGVERRDILGRYTSAARLGVIGETQVAARLRQRVHWKNLSCVPAEVPERVAK